MTPLELRLHEQLSACEKEMKDMLAVFCEAVDSLRWAMDMLNKVKRECPSLYYQAVSKEELRRVK